MFNCKREHQLHFVLQPGRELLCGPVDAAVPFMPQQRINYARHAGTNAKRRHTAISKHNDQPNYCQVRVVDLEPALTSCGWRHR